MIELFSLPNGGTLTYVPRSVWGAGPLRAGARIPLANFLGLVLHHIPELPAAMGIKRPANVNDVGEAIRFMLRLQEIRPDLNNEVPYSWVMLRGATDIDVIVCEGRGQGVTGAHTANINSKRYGVAVAQHVGRVPITSGQVAGFRWIGATMLTAKALEPATQHKDWAHISNYNRTECAAASASLLALLQPPYTGQGVTGAVTPAPAASATTDPLPVLSLNDTGPAVREYQLLVNVLLELFDRALGGDRGRLQVTGTYDAATKQVTESLQKYVGGIDVDGVVGNLETRPALYRALAVASAAAVRAEFQLTPLRPHPSKFGDLADPWRVTL